MEINYLTSTLAQLLITDGTGFIGSHIKMVLLEAGHKLLVFDDFSNSSPIAHDHVREVAGVIHFAGLKAVGESMKKPLHYRDVNVNSSRWLLAAMNFLSRHTLAFSSIASVYGYPEAVQIP